MPNGRPYQLFSIVDVDGRLGVEALIPANSALEALRCWHGEGLADPLVDISAETLVRVRGDRLVFKYPEHQALCSGRWRVRSYSDGGRAGPIYGEEFIYEIEPPPDPEVAPEAAD